MIPLIYSICIRINAVAPGSWKCFPNDKLPFQIYILCTKLCCQIKMFRFVIVLMKKEQNSAPSHDCSPCFCLSAFPPYLPLHPITAGNTLISCKLSFKRGPGCHGTEPNPTTTPSTPPAVHWLSDHLQPKFQITPS